jgi:hypothetical protein
MGFPTESNTDVTVFANVLSVARSEFFSARQAGINAVISFEVHVEDWSGQTVAIYATKEYDIVRAFQKGEGIVVLTCSDKAV